MNDLKVAIAAVVVLALAITTAAVVALNITDVGGSAALATASHFGSTPQPGVFLEDAQAGREQVVSATTALVAESPAVSPASLVGERLAAESLVVTTERVAAQLRHTAAFGVQVQERSRIESAYQAVEAAAQALANCQTIPAANTDMAALNVALSQMSSIQEVP